MTYQVEHCVSCDCCGRDGAHAMDRAGVKKLFSEAGWAELRVDEIITSNGRRARCFAHICRTCNGDEDNVAIAKETAIRRWARMHHFEVPG